MRPHTRWYKRKWFRTTAIIFATWFLLHLLYICIDGYGQFNGQADAAIVLGNRVFANGALAPWTQGRVDKAMELYRNGQVKMIFASGGIGKDNGYPEGKAMGDYLLHHGIPDTAITRDNLGQNTYLTARDFMQWNKTKGCSSVVIVSQFYHITRAKYILRKAGFKGKIYSASSDQFAWKDIVGVIREVPAFYKYVLVY